MLRYLRIATIGLAICVCSGMTADFAYAGTIIKLSLGEDSGPDVEFDGTTLSTADDGVAGSPGDQDTAVDFLDFLGGTTDITSSASVSFDGLTEVGTATVFFGTLVLQNFTGGTLNLYDDVNSLLLSADLGNSTLAGPLGPPATGALFTTTFSSVTGGSLAPLLDPGSLTFSMNMTSINGGAGLSVTSGAMGDELNSFSADALVSIDAEQVPEPASGLIALVGALLAATALYRRAVG